MKKTLIMLMISLLVISFCGFSLQAKVKKYTIGCTIYKFDDTFMNGIRNAILATAPKNTKVEMVDGQNSQPVQNDIVDSFIKKRVNVLAVNPVDRNAVERIIVKAKKARIPLIFFNREPKPEDIKKWDKVYYVGAKPAESGIMEGQIVADYWRKHPETDKNKDGVLQYVLLKGEPGHQDAEARTKYSLKAIRDAGIKVQKLAEDTAMWDRVKGKEKMANFLAAYGNKIETVIANNDDMALGAIEVLKDAGYFQSGKYIPVVGVDASGPALQALAEGTMLGTVLNDAKNQGKVTMRLAYVLAKKQKPRKKNIGYNISKKKYVWIPYKKITKENMNEAK